MFRHATKDALASCTTVASVAGCARAEARRGLREGRAERRTAIARNRRSIAVLGAGVAQLTECQDSGGRGGATGPPQPVCDIGLPQGICDVASGGMVVGSLPIPAGPPGIPELGFPGIPDVPGLDTLIALLAPVPGSLRLGTVRDAIDVPIVSDFVAP
ncbi:MAG: hypothetical protein M3237_22690 [Actinomycetota bacterium]|nr:hypothetical protein [Actinomycetota bacterium]